MPAYHVHIKTVVNETWKGAGEDVFLIRSGEQSFLKHCTSLNAEITGARRPSCFILDYDRSRSLPLTVVNTGTVQIWDTMVGLSN